MGITDKSGAIRSGEEIDQIAIKNFLKKNVAGLAGEITITQFPSGFST